MGRIGSFMYLLWLLKFSLNLSAENLAFFAVLAWCLWTTRNPVRMRGVRKSTLNILQWARSYMEEFQLANYTPTQPRIVTEVFWSPPRPPWFKVNVDGVVFSSLKSVGLGIVIRDQCGNVATVMSKLVAALLGPLETKAKVIEEAILFARDTGFPEILFESDSLTVIQSLNGVIVPPANMANIISDSLQVLISFRQVQFVYVPSSSNKAAHGLAQYARNIFYFVSWIEEPPCIIERILVIDVLFLSSSE